MALLARACALSVLVATVLPVRGAAEERPAPPGSSPASGERPPTGWIGLLGSGLFTLPDTQTVPSGRLVLGFTVDNRDRDPLGLDLLDGALAWSVGLGARMETYGHVVASRVVTVPGRHIPLPSPPVDVIVPSFMAPPRRPYYELFSLTPYVNDRRPARFSEWVPGDAVFGVKRRVAEPRGPRPGIAVAGEVTVPMPHRLADLQSGSGTGSVDLGARAVAEWRVGASGRTSVMGSALFVLTGSTPYGDRLISRPPPATDRSAEVRIADLPLTIPNRLELGVGARRAIRPWLAAALEGSAAMEIGYRSAALDRVTPIDVLAGTQIKRRHLRLTAALRYHGHSPRSGQVRSSPLAGAVDLTDVEPAALAAYLAQAGAGPALAWLRPRSQRVLLGAPAAVPLPPRAVIVPDQYVITSEHQVGFLFVVSWAF